jgi:REP element-mobilizing transposase RayT
MLENAIIHRLILHLIIITADECAPLTPLERRRVCQFIEVRCDPLGTVELLAASCTESHAHLAIRFSPDISVQDVVDDLRSYTGAMLQKIRPVEPFSWDSGYGALSVTPGEELAALKAYIHAEGLAAEAG